MKNVLNVFIFIVLTGLMTGCNSTVKPNDLLSPALALTGGAIAFESSKNESSGTQLAWTGVGTAAGYIFGEFIKDDANKERLKEFQAGYDLGRSNSIKKLYWAQQKMNIAEKQETKYRIINIPQPNYNDGINRVDATVQLPVAY